MSPIIHYGLGWLCSARLTEKKHRAVLAGRFQDGRREVGGAGAEGHVQPEALESLQLGGRPRGADDLRAQRLRELQRGHADARGDAVDQEPLA